MKKTVPSPTKERLKNPIPKKEMISVLDNLKILTPLLQMVELKECKYQDIQKKVFEIIYFSWKKNGRK